MNDKKYSLFPDFMYLILQCLFKHQYIKYVCPAMHLNDSAFPKTSHKNLFLANAGLGFSRHHSCLHLFIDHAGLAETLHSFRNFRDHWNIHLNWIIRLVLGFSLSSSQFISQSHYFIFWRIQLIFRVILYCSMMKMSINFL